MKKSLMGAVALCAVCFPSLVHAVTIDFNDKAAGQSIANEYAGLGVTFSTDSGGPTFNAAISSYFPGFGTPDPALTNSRDGSSDRQTFLNIDFSSAANGVSFLYNNYGGLFIADTVKSYAGATLLETLSVPNDSGSSLKPVVFSLNGITRITIEQPRSGWIFAIDDLTYSLSAGGVPEPAAWAMMLAGFGLVGSAMRRRQKVAVTFA